jgi:hypothetical protein
MSGEGDLARLKWEEDSSFEGCATVLFDAYETRYPKVSLDEPRVCPIISSSFDVEGAL